MEKGSQVSLFLVSCLSVCITVCASVSPYPVHKAPTTISGLQFCPYEDVLGMGHGEGFSSLLIPGKLSVCLSVCLCRPTQYIRPPPQYRGFSSVGMRTCCMLDTEKASQVSLFLVSCLSVCLCHFTQYTRPPPQYLGFSSVHMKMCWEWGTEKGSQVFLFLVSCPSVCITIYPSVTLPSTQDPHHYISK